MRYGILLLIGIVMGGDISCVQNVTRKLFDSEIENSKGIVYYTSIDIWLIKFYTDWSGPCKKMSEAWNNFTTKLCKAKSPIKIGQINV